MTPALIDGPVTVYLGHVHEPLLTVPSVPVLTTERAAYFAALIDGEGSLECQRQMHRNGRTPRYVIRLSFTMVTHEPLRAVGSWLGLQPKWYPATSASRQPRWRLHIAKGLLVRVLADCLPHLILKRDQAELLLRIEHVRLNASPGRRHFGTAKLEPMPRYAVEAMEGLYRELRRLKGAC